MRMSCIPFLAIVGGCLICSTAHSRQVAYAIVIGNNAPLPNDDDSLPMLRYADDDAVRYYAFFRRMTDRAYLFTVPDARTQKRYPNIASFAKVPTLQNIERAVEEIESHIQKTRKSGAETILYIAYSGHGRIDDAGRRMLSLIGEPLTTDYLYDEILSRLKADYQHLLIDSCYAEGFADSKGLFDHEVNTQTIEITKDDVETFKRLRQSRFPGLGLILASSANEESHEWSQIESGVFTHEVLSGLAGPADVNLDGKIEYSELVAFVAAANSGVADPRSRVDIVADPPGRNQRAPLVDLLSLKNVGFLYGDPSELGHFHIELENGERYLDANLGHMENMHVVLPEDQVLYLRTRNKEATLYTSRHAHHTLADLRFSGNRTAKKGSAEAALKRGLFATQFGRPYYKGYVDSEGIISVPFTNAAIMSSRRIDPLSSKKFKLRKRLSITSFATAGGAAVASIVLAAFSIKAKHDFEDTRIQKEGHTANERYVKFGNAAWILGATVPLVSMLGALVWPKTPSAKDPVTVGINQRAFELNLEVDF
jgi:hypothetical protein